MSAMREIAKGHWQEILPEFGIPHNYLVNKHGPCPMCGGRDRWRFDDKSGNGTYYCSQCGSGDGFMLLQKISKQNFKDVSAKVCQVLKVPNPEPEQKTQEPPKNVNPELARAQKIWHAATPPTKDSPTGKYLLARLGRLDQRPSVRDGSYYTGGQHHPALICLVATANGEPANLHLTLLTPNGEKAKLSPAKRVLSGTLPEGCAIRLNRINSPIMGIAEGIETALSAEMIFGMPTWAAVNANSLAKWMPPAGIEEVVIYSDNDLNYTGQSRAYTLANKLVMKGLRARVRIPPEPGQDWNDVLLKQVLSYSQ